MSISRIIEWCFPHDNWEVNKYSVVWQKRLLHIILSEFYWQNIKNGILIYSSVAEKEGYFCSILYLPVIYFLIWPNAKFRRDGQTISTEHSFRQARKLLNKALLSVTHRLLWNCLFIWYLNGQIRSHLIIFFLSLLILLKDNSGLSYSRDELSLA